MGQWFENQLDQGWVNGLRDRVFFQQTTPSGPKLLIQEISDWNIGIVYRQDSLPIQTRATAALSYTVTNLREGAGARVIWASIFIPFLCGNPIKFPLQANFVNDLFKLVTVHGKKICTWALPTHCLSSHCGKVGTGTGSHGKNICTWVLPTHCLPSHCEKVGTKSHGKNICTWALPTHCLSSHCGKVGTKSHI